MKSQAWSPIVLGLAFAGLALLSSACAATGGRDQSPTPTPKPAFGSPEASVDANWWQVRHVVICDTDGIGAYLRRTPGGERIVARPDGTELEVIETGLATGEAVLVRDGRGNEGWVSSDYLCLPSEIQPVALPTPRPTASTPHVVREYPERQADGSIASVQQWSDGRYAKQIVKAPPSPAVEEPPLSTVIDDPRFDWEGFAECLRNRPIVNPNDIYNDGDCRTRYLYLSSPKTPLWSPPAAPERPVPAPQPQGAPAVQMANVVRVTDGDTIVVTLRGTSTTVRYFGNDTPELGQKCYAEATARNRELVDGRVSLESDARDIDANGRLLRYVYAESGIFVDAQLIKEGLAHAWTTDGKHRGYLMGLEAEARRNRVGCLWR